MVPNKSPPAAQRGGTLASCYEQLIRAIINSGCGNEGMHVTVKSVFYVAFGDLRVST